MKTVFVILHYLVDKMTAASIDALLQTCNRQNFDIVVVDNASNNGSGQRLAAKYQEHSNIHFIFMPENEGFARGNNAGYQFAKEKLSADFIVIMNNDVLIEDNDFIHKIEQEYKAQPFAVLGPDILCPATGEHQSPAHLSGFTEKEIIALREKIASSLKHFYLKRICWEIKLCLGLAHKPESAKENLYSSEQINCILHGACYIFSKDFINNRLYAFNPNTFLYFEEDILHYECLRDGLVMRYTPKIQVKHLEDAATKKAVKLNIVREKMKREYSLKSIDILLNIMHDDSVK